MRAEPDTWQIDAAGGVLKASRVMTEIVGHHIVTSPGFSVNDVIHPEDRDALYDPIKAGVAFMIAYRVRNQDGGWTWVRSVGRPTADGGFIGTTELREDPPRRLAPMMAVAQCLWWIVFVA